METKQRDEDSSVNRAVYICGYVCEDSPILLCMHAHVKVFFRLHLMAHTVPEVCLFLGSQVCLYVLPHASVQQEHRLHAVMA